MRDNQEYKEQRKVPRLVCELMIKKAIKKLKVTHKENQTSVLRNVQFFAVLGFHKDVLSKITYP